jgi:hypothetical protein
LSESTASYDDKRVNNLRKKLWAAAFKFAEEARDKGRTLSGLELLMALHQMIEETHHHWIEDKKKWHDILGASSPDD